MPSPTRIRALGETVRRARHAAAHSALARSRPRGDVFNLDLHVGVISDVRSHLERRGISLVDWTLSGHSWTLGRERDPVAIVNERTWFGFGPRMAKRFRRVYSSYLRTFKGFVATYPPGFALLYEGLGKPTLALAATRYEWPLTHFEPGWEWLDERLRAGVDAGWLTLVANNRADADYLREYSGLSARHIPSACSYVGRTYTGRKAQSVLLTTDALGSEIAGLMRTNAVPLRAGLGQRYSQADLYDCRALILIPYNVSVMALFEHYTACAPLYVPARPLLKQLMAQYPADVLSSLSFCQVTGRPPTRRPDELDLNDTRDERVIDWYLDRADFYDEEWMPHVRRFESWDHLDHLLESDDPQETSSQMLRDREARLRRIDALWDGLRWLSALQGSR